MFNKENIKSLRFALGKSLGIQKPISQLSLGLLVGYSKKAAKRNVERLEAGDTGISSVVNQKLIELYSSAKWAVQENIVVPEWTEIYPCDEEDDAGLYFIQRNWFPRLLIAAIPRKCSNEYAEAEIGQIDDYSIQILQSDIITKDIASLKEPMNKIIETGFMYLKRQIEEDV